MRGGYWAGLHRFAAGVPVAGAPGRAVQRYLGQRQRLSLARAFLRRPKLYIFDESTANLDEQTAAAVLTNLERHAAADGAGILYISHDQNVVDRCDQVIVLANSIASHSPGPEKAAPGCACTLPS